MNTPDLDTLIEATVSSALVGDKRSMHSDLPAALFAGVHLKAGKARMPAWTAEDERFLAENLGVLSEAEIGEALGRTVCAVHIHWKRDMGLKAPSKKPDILTANQAAKLLGVDGHSTALWVDAGLIPGRLMAGERKIRLIDRKALERWALDVNNWIYFDIEKIADGRLRRLTQLRKKRWGDEWLRTTEVAAMHGVTTSEIKRMIQMGRLPSAVHVEHSLCGRHKSLGWATWLVLRSDAEKLVIHTRANMASMFTPAGDRFLVHAIDDLGYSSWLVARLMNGKRQRRPGAHAYTDGGIYARHKKLTREAK
jgi:hypothetical protein